MSGPGSGIGDNIEVLNQTAQGQLKSIVDRIERLEVEKAEIVEQIKEVYDEAKGNGFQTKPIRQIIAARKKDRDKAIEERAILELYASALGILDMI